jgi:hypothetical protein
VSHSHAVQTFVGVPQQLGAYSGSVALLHGDSVTAQTVSLAKKLVEAAVLDPAVNVFAIQIVRGTPQYDNLSKAEAIFNWVRENYYYIQDPIGPYGAKETLRPMRDQMQLLAGDCDDVNMVFIPSLLGTIGYGSRVVTVKADREVPTEFSHVYCEAKIDGEWIPMDCARPGAQFGEEPPVYWDRKDWPIVDDVPFSLMGCASTDGEPCGCGCSSGRGLSGIVSRNWPHTMGQWPHTMGASKGVRGMGDIDDSTLAQDISAATIGSAAIVSAANQNPYSYLSVSNSGVGTVSPQLAYTANTAVMTQLEGYLPLIIGVIVLMALVGGKK